VCLPSLFRVFLWCRAVYSFFIGCRYFLKIKEVFGIVEKWDYNSYKPP